MIYFFLPEIGSQSNWELNSGDCNIAAFCLSLTSCREVSPPRRLCGRVLLPTGGGSVGIDPHHITPGAGKGTWISVLESCSLLRHMAHHFFPWSAVLDSHQPCKTGSRLSSVTAVFPSLFAVMKRSQIHSCVTSANTTPSY